MATDDTRIGNRVPAVLRVRLKYEDVDTFIEKFSGNVSRGGLFIATKTPQPVGAAIKFEFQLAQGTPVVKGEGEVIWVKPFDAAAPTKPHGMGVKFTRLDAESRAVVDRALQWKERDKAKPNAPATASAPAPTVSAPPPPIPTPPPVNTKPPIVNTPEVNTKPPIVNTAAAAHSTGNGVGELDELAAAWGVTDERIARTIERVRAERIDVDELDRLSRR